MKGKRIIHPVDIQDREGFLRFLNDQARKGWEVESIGPFSTTFRKTDTPPRGYTMAYDRDKVWPYENEEGYHIVPCSLEGFAVYPTDELVLPDPTWPEQVLDEGGGNAPSLAFGNRFRSLPLVLPFVVLLDLLGVELSRWGTISSVPIEGPMFWVLLALCIVALSGAVLMLWTEHGHKKGLRAAWERKTVYRPSERLAKLTWLKNRLVRVQTALSLLTLVLYFVFNGIASGTIRL